MKHLRLILALVIGLMFIQGCKKDNDKLYKGMTKYSDTKPPAPDWLVNRLFITTDRSLFDTTKMYRKTDLVTPEMVYVSDDFKRGVAFSARLFRKYSNRELNFKAEVKFYDRSRYIYDEDITSSCKRDFYLSKDKFYVVYRKDKGHSCGADEDYFMFAEKTEKGVRMKFPQESYGGGEWIYFYELKTIETELN